MEQEYCELEVNENWSTLEGYLEIQVRYWGMVEMDLLRNPSWPIARADREGRKE